MNDPRDITHNLRTAIVDRHGQAGEDLHRQRVDARAGARRPQARCRESELTPARAVVHFRARTAADRAAADAARRPALPQRLPYNRNRTAGATLRSFRGVVASRLRALPRGGAVRGRRPRAARLPAARPELRVDRRARSRDLRLPAAAAAGDRSRGRAIRACTAAGRCSRRRGRSRSATSIRTSISPAASPATPSSICAMMGSYDWRLADTNVWKVERMLLDYPHRPHRDVGRAVRQLRARYRAFRAANRAEAALLPRPGRWTELPRIRVTSRDCVLIASTKTRRSRLAEDRRPKSTA